MDQYRFSRFSLPPAGWRGRLGVIAATALGLALALALIVVSVGFLLVLVPVVAVGLAVARWRFRKTMEARTTRTGEANAGGQTIEIEYHVIPPDSGARR